MGCKTGKYLKEPVPSAAEKQEIAGVVHFTVTVADFVLRMHT